MSSPVELPDLPIATIANDNDTTLLRQGLTDYQCAVSLIRNINVQALSPLPGNTAAATDLFLISRIISGNPNNFQIPFNQVGFLKSTKAWFWQAVAPSGWTIVPNTSDRVLASSGPNLGYGSPTIPPNGGQQVGTWQQQAITLTLAQIPSHNHTVPTGKESTGSSLTPAYARRARNFDPDSVITSGNSGGTQSHNHGNVWRPAANVGIICNKTN